jgi:hypothetical protein
VNDGAIEASSFGAGAFVVRDPDTYAAFMGEDPFPSVFVLHLNRLSTK